MNVTDMDNGISKIEEYKALREELRESKRYVFERPLLAVAAIFAAAQFADKHQIALLPAIAISILTFNFWFTVNRLRSSTRIVAYIQVVLEDRNVKDFIGWENFLRHQRLWMKLNQKRLSEIFREKIREDAIPDALFYYPAIFKFHVLMVLASCAASIALLVKSKDLISIMSMIVAFSVAAYFFVSCMKSRPSKMKRLIEEYRVIVIEVLKYIRQSGETGDPSSAVT